MPSHTVVEEYLRTDRAAREAVGWTQEHRLELLGEGVYNRAFRLDVPGKPPRVVRLGLHAVADEEVAGRVAREASILAHLSGRGVTAELIWFEPRGPEGCPLLVMEYLPGRELEYRPEDLPLAAEVYARLHATPGPFPARVRLDERPSSSFLQESRGYLARYDAWPGRDREVSGLLGEAAARLSSRELRVERPVLTHGDASFNNWRIGARDARLIDWDCCLVTAAAADLAHFLSPVTVRRYRGRTLSPDQRELFLQRYLQARPEGREVRDELPVFSPQVVLRSVTWVAARVAELSLSGREPTPCLLRQLEPAFLRRLRQEGWL